MKKARRRTRMRFEASSSAACGLCTGMQVDLNSTVPVTRTQPCSWLTSSSLQTQVVKLKHESFRLECLLADCLSKTTAAASGFQSPSKLFGHVPEWISTSWKYLTTGMLELSQLSTSMHKLKVRATPQFRATRNGPTAGLHPGLPALCTHSLAIQVFISGF